MVYPGAEVSVIPLTHADRQKLNSGLRLQGGSCSSTKTPTQRILGLNIEQPFVMADQ